MSDLFPKGCKCLSYGHGLTMTRVISPHCPLHGSAPRTQPDFFIDGKPYEGECIFSDLGAVQP